MKGVKFERFPDGNWEFSLEESVLGEERVARITKEIQDTINSLPFAPSNEFCYAVTKEVLAKEGLI